MSNYHDEKLINNLRCELSEHKQLINEIKQVATLEKYGRIFETQDTVYVEEPCNPQLIEGFIPDMMKTVKKVTLIEVKAKRFDQLVELLNRINKKGE